MRNSRQGFSLLELLVVIGIIAVLVGILFPSLSRARARSQTVACLSHLRELGKAAQMYADDNEDVLVPHRMSDLTIIKDPQPPPPTNLYDVGNGVKLKPRWAAMLGPHLGVLAFNKPDKDKDRQDYDNEAYQCPTEAAWVDERNYAYGYNYQFLGNARGKPKAAPVEYYHFPIKRHLIKAAAGTVMAADALGTAAAVSLADRASYRNDGTGMNDMGNHGYTLDPPRLTDKCDRGTGDPGSPRTAVDPRHQDKVNAVFVDGHGATVTDHELGYRKRPSGRYVDRDPNDSSGDSGGPVGGGTASAGPGGTVTAGASSSSNSAVQVGLQQQAPGADFASNNMFSGTGRDEDPPAIP